MYVYFLSKKSSIPQSLCIRVNLPPCLSTNGAIKTALVIDSAMYYNMTSWQTKWANIAIWIQTGVNLTFCILFRQCLPNYDTLDIVLALRLNETLIVLWLVYIPVSM